MKPSKHNDYIPLISVVVPTRNRALLLWRLLESFEELRYLEWEGLVADDGSTDSTALVVEEFIRSGLPLRYLYQPWSKMGAARNRAIEQARGEILAFTDDDCTVDPNWLSVIASAFQTHPQALGVQGRTVTDHAAMTPFTRQVEHLEAGQPYRTCNIAYRASIVQELGGFDTQLIRGEDVVLGARVAERGDIVFEPEALVCHPPRPKEWAGRTEWLTLMNSELHFKQTYPQYMGQRSPTLSVQKSSHVFSRWVLLPIRRYWRSHWSYFRRRPLDYLRHVPLIIYEKLALLSLFPYFFANWLRPSSGFKAKSHVSRLTSQVHALTSHFSLLTPPRITVVIPTRNRVELLKRTLQALEQQTYGDYEVVVVDDASTDGSADFLAGWQGDRKQAIRLPESLGSYAARNVGWRAATGSVIAFTDDDCVPAPEWLAAIARVMATSDVPAVQGTTLIGSSRATPFTHQIEQVEPGPPYRTCNIAYRRGILESLGGFDESLRWYADNIFGLRVSEMARLGFAPDAIVYHPPRSRDWRDESSWRRRFLADAKHRGVLRELGREPSISVLVLPFLLWIVRPALKQSLAHLGYFLRRPTRYLREVQPMAGEKRALLAAMVTPALSKSAADERNSVLPALPPEPLVSVVVVTNKPAANLHETLDALRRQTWTKRELVVVAHGNPEFELHGEIRVVHAPSDATLGSVRQMGLEAARGDLVAFTDDDCLPDPEWLAVAVETLKRDSRLAGVQGRTDSQPGAVGSHWVHVSGPDSLYRTCNICYRKEALDHVGGFDTRFRRYFEDTALGARVTSLAPIDFEPRMRVTHRTAMRRPLDRAAWRVVAEDEERLAQLYPHFYRRHRAASPFYALVVRWGVGSALKTLLRDACSHHVSLGRLMAVSKSLLIERFELARFLLTRQRVS